MLRQHQLAALERIRRMLEEWGGALLADDVGLGKTYVGAALAREYGRVLVVAPATLRTMWYAALRKAGVEGSVTSYAALSRGGGPRDRFDLLLLDEAHHARTPGTRRYARIAELADGAHILLLSATPIHNSRRDLAALLALFLGSRAMTLGDDALARHVVRREREDVPAAHIPDSTPPIRVALREDESLLGEIMALPPPLPPRDAEGGEALVAWGLVRAWASSNAALLGALRRRLVRAAALDAALDGGSLPSRRELATWLGGEDAVQLALPGLLDMPSGTHGEHRIEKPSAERIAAMRTVLARHERGVRSLIERATASTWTDAERANALREIRAKHPGEKVVAFTQFADTARALFRELRRDDGVAVLTARGASVAGGTLTRREAIERFAPRAAEATAPRAIERIDFLIATDLLSEGVNLHDASVVVHVDLPWTAARLEQRVGRSRRMGALHARTTVYALDPPAASEALLGVERRLHTKLGAATTVLGGAGTLLLPATGGDPCAESATGAARRHELIARELRRWRDESGYTSREREGRDGIVIAAAAGAGSGLLALVADGAEYHLVAARDDGKVDDDPVLVLDMARQATAALAESGRGVAGRASSQRFDAPAALERVVEWASRRAGLLAAGSTLELRASARGCALRRVAAIAARAPRHRRMEITRLAALARRVVAAPYGAGGERALAELAASQLSSGEEWLRALGEFGAARRPASGAGQTDALRVEPVAILVLIPRRSTPPEREYTSAWHTNSP